MVILGDAGGIVGIYRMSGGPWYEKIGTYVESMQFYRGLNGILEGLGPICK
jgi:hypothetical protein